MKKPNREKRVINIDKSEFDIIKKFCDNSSYSMSKWITNVTLREIDKINNIKDIKTKVGTLVGEASVCWKCIPTSEFNSTRASQIYDELLELITSYKK
jgi:hypothetical protein